MGEARYTNRELDQKFTHIQNGLQTITTQIETGFKGVHDRQDITNGKVNKSIVAIVAIVARLIGLGFKEFAAILPAI